MGAVARQGEEVTDDELNIDDEMRALIGKVVSRLIKPDAALEVHEIINALHHLRVRSPDHQIRLTCQKAMRLLARKLH
ncbi:hypothetical protein [Pantoea sp. C2G6]|uniref:hypothetical protein n=1 Tax=Pantoea sp. C2G6 TaxID=3243084 RepID=UPI003ED93835